jgi:hypothetical protein
MHPDLFLRPQTGGFFVGIFPNSSEERAAHFSEASIIFGKGVTSDDSGSTHNLFFLAVDGFDSAYKGLTACFANNQNLKNLIWQ